MLQNAVVERDDELVAEEAHAGSVVGRLLFVDTVFVVIAIAECQLTRNGTVAPKLNEIEVEKSFGADVVDVAVGGRIDGRVVVFYPVNHVGAMSIEPLGLYTKKGACIGKAEVPICTLFWF